MKLTFLIPFHQKNHIYERTNQGWKSKEGKKKEKKKRKGSKNILARIKNHDLLLAEKKRKKKANEGTLRAHIKGPNWQIANVQDQGLRPFSFYYYYQRCGKLLISTSELHGQTLQFQRCWSVNVIRPKKHTLIISNPEKRLEEWTNIRNTKTQYSKQLRNFLKVRIQSY
jgi:hypothetical protein